MTDKQRRFAEEFVRSGNKTQAAMAAGYGNSYASAATQAVRLYKNAEIQAYINQLQASMVEQGMADAREIGLFLSQTMRDRSAPWGARMLAAAQLNKRLSSVPQSDKAPSVVIVDDIADS